MSSVRHCWMRQDDASLSDFVVQLVLFSGKVGVVVVSGKCIAHRRPDIYLCLRRLRLWFEVLDDKRKIVRWNEHNKNCTH